MPTKETPVKSLIDADNVHDLGLCQLRIGDNEDSDEEALEGDLSCPTEYEGVLALVSEFLDCTNDKHFVVRRIAHSVYGLKKNYANLSNFKRVDIWKKMKRFVKEIIIDTATYDALTVQVVALLSELRDRFTALKNHTSKYVSYGIGSASPQPDMRNYLACFKDLDLFEQYSLDNNYFLGYSLEKGSSPSFDQILTRIRFCCVAAFEVEANAVIFYTGHADINGNWWFYDGNITLEMFCDTVALARKDCPQSESNRVYVVADCCFAGKWAQELKAEGIVVIAAAGENNVAGDETFSQIFFDSMGTTIDTNRVQQLRKEELQTELKNITKSSSMIRGKVAELRGLLCEQLSDKKRRLVKNSMKQKPIIGIHDGVQDMEESDLVSELWFSKKRSQVG
jgi:hypothetical protein